MSKSELYRLAVQRGEPLPDDIAQLNARVAMLSEAIKEIWYSNSTPIAETKYHEVINATEADVTKWVNGVRAARDAEWMAEPVAYLYEDSCGKYKTPMVELTTINHTYHEC